jgi:hypothetical protein
MQLINYYYYYYIIIIELTVSTGHFVLIPARKVLCGNSDVETRQDVVFFYCW